MVAGPAGSADDGDDPDDEDEDGGYEPYCVTCGGHVGMFWQMAGWHHFRGQPEPGGKRELYVAGHEAAVAWRERQS